MNFALLFFKPIILVNKLLMRQRPAIKKICRIHLIKENRMKAKKSILVVDDDIAHRTMLRILLEWEFEIVEADCGSKAIEKIRNEPFDLVLMDVCMPEISGVEALDRIKATNPEVPVVMMTAYSSAETANRAMEKGAYDYLTKPFDFDNLKLTIEKAMAHA
jgi:two-component system response regulator HydG